MMWGEREKRAIWWRMMRSSSPPITGRDPWSLPWSSFQNYASSHLDSSCASPWSILTKSACRQDKSLPRTIRGINPSHKCGATKINLLCVLFWSIGHYSSMRKVTVRLMHIVLRIVRVILFPQVRRCMERSERHKAFGTVFGTRKNVDQTIFQSIICQVTDSIVSMIMIHAVALKASTRW